MGFRDIFKSDRQKRAEKAADQIYARLIAGQKLEIPNSMSMDDDVSLAVMALRKKYPGTVCTMLQSKTIILTAGDAGKARMSQQAWGILDAHGYFPDPRVPMEMLFDAHAAFAEAHSGGGAETIKEAAEQDAKERFESRKIVLE